MTRLIACVVGDIRVPGLGIGARELPSFALRRWRGEVRQPARVRRRIAG